MSIETPLSKYLPPKLRRRADQPSKLERQIKALDDHQLHRWIDQSMDSLFESVRAFRGPHAYVMCNEAKRTAKVLTLLFDEYFERLEPLQPDKPARQVW